MRGGDKEAREQEVLGGPKRAALLVFWDQVSDVAGGRVVDGFVSYFQYFEFYLLGE